MIRVVRMCVVFPCKKHYKVSFPLSTQTQCHCSGMYARWIYNGSLLFDFSLAARCGCDAWGFSAVHENPFVHDGFGWIEYVFLWFCWYNQQADLEQRTTARARPRAGVKERTRAGTKDLSERNREKMNVRKEVVGAHKENHVLRELARLKPLISV